MSVLTLPIDRLSTGVLTHIARISIYLGIACSMLCVPMLNKFYWLAVILFIFSGSLFQSGSVLIKDKVIVTALILVGLFAIGIFYTQGSTHFGLRVCNKYLKLIYLLMFIPLFTEKKYRDYAVIAFITSVMVSEVFAYLHYFKVILLGFGPGKHWLFVQDLDASFVVSFACFLFATIAVEYKKYRFLALLALAICSFDILVLNQERAGYLVYMGLTGLFLWQRLKWRGLLSAVLVVPLLFTSLYMFSPKFNNRINLVVHNITEYQKGNETTSIGLRLAFAKYSFMVIREHPIFGAGTGSFEELYRKLNGPKLENNTWPAHPHNEYLYVLFQIGTIGLAVFLYWFYLLLKASFALAQYERYLLQGLIVAFCLLSVCNASLLVNPAGAIFVTFASVFLASRYQKQPLLRSLE